MKVHIMGLGQDGRVFYPPIQYSGSHMVGGDTIHTYLVGNGVVEVVVDANGTYSAIAKGLEWEPCVHAHVNGKVKKVL